MPPVVCIVGRPQSGKTTLIDRLIVELKERGYKVATIKHTTHDFETDTAGKDSWKHAQAGSECIVLSSAHKLTLTRTVERDLSPTELSRLITDDFDIVLAEGYKKSDELKIEVHRQEMGEPVCPPDELMAIVTDQEFQFETPRFSHDQSHTLSDLIEEKVLKPRKNVEIALFVDGQSIPLLPFIKNLYQKIIFDMVAVLKGVRNPKRIDVSIKRR